MPNDAGGGPGNTSGGVSGVVVDGSKVDAVDVFISYGSSDMALARELRSHLQAGGYICWMAPDDVAGPKTWAEQIVEAIAACKVMLVLVSSVSNASDHVSKEVDLAIEHGKAILPVRIEDVVPSGALRYLLALAQWIDAFPGPLGPHADEVKRRVAAIVSSKDAEGAPIEEPVAGSPPPVQQPVERPRAEPERRPAESARRPAWMKWAVLGVVAAVVLGAGAALLLLMFDDGPYEYGDDTRLDWLWDRCDAGDMESCDALVAEAADGTDYAFFGETCGERVVGGGECVTRDVGDEGPYGYGDDPGLDELWDGCNGEDFDACAELYELAPIETEYEWFGGSCGGRTEFPQGCGPLLGEPGDLDALWERCAEGDMEGCWILSEMSPVGSEYEAFGLTCGGRTDGNVPCVTTYGDSAYLDELWDECAEGDMEMCDLLYVESPVGTEYEDFGWSCGWRTEEGGECSG